MNNDKLLDVEMLNSSFSKLVNASSKFKAGRELMPEGFA
jgi:hypothetical protein